jgi:protein-S-isoprenylcysteine O-methyltransferase Ste14
MRVSEFSFRFRRWLLLLIFTIGFWAPWERIGGARPGTTWLFLAGLLARYSRLSMGDASIAVMGAAILCALLAAMLRTWGAAYLGPVVVGDTALHGQRLVADGPYRYVRNPLYVGTWLHALALAVLMPPGGALFAVVAVAALNTAKVRAEERHLQAANGEAYAVYARRVPRFFCARMPRLPAGEDTAHWRAGFLNEIYMWGVVVTYVAFAGRYNVTILEQGVLISLGVSLLVRGIMRPSGLARV